MKEECDVLVAGAGISGLVAAYELQRQGLDVQVVDPASRVGGVIGTRSHEGGLYELGPNSTLDTSPLINALLDRLGIREERIDGSAIASRRFIVRGGELIALPMSPPAFLKTRAFSTRAKLRLLREPFIPPAPPELEESIAGFVLRRLGREFLDYAIDPFVAGIYAGDPTEISVPAAFPRLHALEQKYGSLIKGQIKGRRERARNAETARNAATSFSFRRGMQTLPDALGRSLHHIALGARVMAITPSATGGFAVALVQGDATHTLRARAVVLSVPAGVAADLVAPLHREAERALRAIEYAAIAIVATMYRRNDVRHPLDGFGFLVPRVERRRILGGLFSSSMFPGRAPEDSALVTTFAGGRRNPEITALPDDEVAQVVRDELALLLGAGQPLWQQVVRWSRAIPQYTLGHLDRLEAVAAAETTIAGLHFCANYRGGVSVGDCIKSGCAAAERAAALLKTRPPAALP